MGFMNRLSGLFVAAGMFLASKIYGFESGDVPGTRPDDAARFLLCLFPLVLSAIGVVFTFFVKFDEEKIKRPPLELAIVEGEKEEVLNESMDSDSFTKTE